MKKKKYNQRFISPKNYIKKPSEERELKERLKTKNLNQYERVKKYQEERKERYDIQQAKIAEGRLPSKSSQEIKAFLRTDPFKRVTAPTIKTAPMYSKEQSFMRGFFGHGDKVIFGSKDSESLPQMNGALMPYEHGDDSESGTAESFGLGTIKRRTGLY